MRASTPVDVLLASRVETANDVSAALSCLYFICSCFCFSERLRGIVEHFDKFCCINLQEHSQTHAYLILAETGQNVSPQVTSTDASVETAMRATSAKSVGFILMSTLVFL